MKPDHIPFLDVRPQEDADAVNSAIKRVIDSGQFILGPEVQAFEQEFAEASALKYAVGVGNGTDALCLLLEGLGIGPGDEVITTALSAGFTAIAIIRSGATPVFVDIDPRTFNVDPHCVRSAITPATKAVIPVHLFGLCAEMDALNTLAQQHQLHLIEDAAQAIGAQYRGQAAGSIGQIGCFSFYPTKNLGGFGDGGMLTTSEDALAQRLQLLRGHGMHPRYYHEMVGINSRLDAIQAAVLNVKIAHLDAWAQARQRNAQRYTELFESCGLNQRIGLPQYDEHCENILNQYKIRIRDERRAELRTYLQNRQVGTEIYYPVPLHQQHCFQSLGYEAGSLPETERAAAEVLSLPIYPEVTASEQQTVVHHIHQFFETK